MSRREPASVTITDHRLTHHQPLAAVHRGERACIRGFVYLRADQVSRWRKAVAVPDTSCQWRAIGTSSKTLLARDELIFLLQICVAPPWLAPVAKQSAI